MNIEVISLSVGIVCGVSGIAVSVGLIALPGVEPRSISGTGGIDRLLRYKWQLLGALLAAVLVVGITGWPVAGVASVVAVLVIPRSIRGTSKGASTDKVEAVAVWTEFLRDNLAASSGLSQAVMATAGVAPVPIRPAVERLAARLSNGIPLADGLRALADEISDPAADMVVSALLLAASARSARLSDVLETLSESIRDEVSMRLRVEASRSAARSSVRAVLLFSVCFAALLAVLAKSYLTPYDGLLGQSVLFVVVALYTVGLGLMLRLVRPQARVRLLSTEVRTWS